MLERLKPLFNRSSLSTKERLEHFKKRFYDEPAHYWISEHRSIKRCFEGLFDRFDAKTLKFIEAQSLLFLRSSGKLSCALGSLQNQHVIIVYPDLIKTMQSALPDSAIAVLAHEMGHIIHGHTSRNMSTLEAQVEADKYAFNLGLGHELQDVLLEHQESVECKVRIARLTALLLTQTKEV